jgi:sugar lactone lactonase YvrE
MKTLIITLFAVAVSIAASIPAARLEVRTVAGIPGVAGSSDGVAGVATFDHPTWIGFDPAPGAPTLSAGNTGAGSLFVVDRANELVRRIDSGTVTSLSFLQFQGSNTPVSLDFGGPFGGGIAVEPVTAGCGAGPFAHGFFVAGSGQDRVLLLSDQGVVAARDGLPIVGVLDAPGDRDGSATSAQFRTPTAIALSWGYRGNSGANVTDRVYVADTGNHTIRQFTHDFGAEGCPLPDRVSTLAGSAGTAGSEDGRGSSARFNSPRGLVAAPDGSLYVADSGNHTIRRIAPDGSVTTVAGEAGVAGRNDGAARTAHLNTPSGIDIDSEGNLIIADTGNATIRKLTPDGQLETIAGIPGVGGHADGPALAALFNGPVGVKVVGDTIFIADTSNNVIRSLQEIPTGTPHRAARH